jgi:hypothetical protein
MVRAGLRRHAIPGQFMACGIVPQKAASRGGNFRHVWQAPEPIEPASVSYPGTFAEGKMRVSIRHFPNN